MKRWIHTRNGVGINQKSQKRSEMVFFLLWLKSQLKKTTNHDASERQWFFIVLGLIEKKTSSTKHLYLKAKREKIGNRFEWQVIPSEYENIAQKYIHHFRKWRNECIWQIKSCKTIALRDRAIIYQGKRQAFCGTHARDWACYTMRPFFSMFNFKSMVLLCVRALFFSFFSFSVALCQCVCAFQYF